jgi:hypothetical protein
LNEFRDHYLIKKFLNWIEKPNVLWEHNDSIGPNASSTLVTKRIYRTPMKRIKPRNWIEKYN